MIQIAVCDDQKLVSEKIKEMILHGDENRYEVEVFSDGRALLNSGKTFDILFLDIDMPGLDGIETAKALRKSDKKVKIIYITNYGGFAGYAFGVHAFGYLLKPVKEPDIKRQLKEAREYMEKERERRTKINTRIESLERRIQEAEAAEVNEMVRTAKVTPEQLAALLRQSATSTPTPAALSAVGATFNKEDDSNEDDE